MKIANLSPDSKIWIYQSNRKFTDSEVAQITEKGSEFISLWNSHGNMLKAAIEVKHNLFVIFGVDEIQAKASGCSIDKSVAFIKEIEARLKVSLLDRMQIAYKKEDEITSSHLMEFELQLKSGHLNENTIVFNNLVTTKEEFDSSWELPVKDSWHKSLL
ncbi:MAG: ABC transporter ATPase [Bacteroidetes bacterium]|nr:ABC transporter ATPase [Bacteroidota bacterium]HET6244515.1 ABC transporter ATPase [Bacteroidia bacterium]